METETNYVTSLILPTLLLWLTVSAPRVESMPIARELFGSESHYLDVRWENKESGRFYGYFASDVGETKIFGRRKWVKGSWQYEFASHEGSFRGKLISVKGRCEPELVYEISPIAPSQKVQTGKLRAAFCGA